MRNVASTLLLACFTCSLALPAAAEQDATISAFTPAEQSEAQLKYGTLQETPNQRRIRLGQSIVMSYPPREYGELIETPNQHRARLGLPPPEAADTGESLETPNQRRARLKSQTASALR